MNRSARVLVMLVTMGGGSLACDRPPTPSSTTSATAEPGPSFRNVATATAYVGDTTCTSCHAAETSAYHQHAMSKSFHRWTEATRIEPTLATPRVARQREHTVRCRPGRRCRVRHRGRSRVECSRRPAGTAGEGRDDREGRDTRGGAESSEPCSHAFHRHPGLARRGPGTLATLRTHSLPDGRRCVHSITSCGRRSPDG